jgi:allophanate hydrolase
MTWDPATGSLDRVTLHCLYRSGELRSEAVIDAVYRRIEARGDDHVWISLLPRHAALACAAQLSAQRVSAEALPRLWSLPRDQG